jgi:hypothetical protein
VNSLAEGSRKRREAEDMLVLHNERENIIRTEVTLLELKVHMEPLLKQISLLSRICLTSTLKDTFSLEEV